ncbi:MAG: fasciclin domain-containing protein [Acidimicrobiia bacterium]|nr:fasciclin domain-containing protein [Acidimicrobiia bacterium]
MWKRLVPFILVLALVAAACGGDDADETTTTDAPATTEAPAEGSSVVDLAVENGGFSTLVAAIEAAGLVETLDGEGPFTVLAPTNEAFDAAFAALGITAEELLADTDTLTQILTYHVLPLEANSQLVSTLDGEMVETVNGQSVSIAVNSGVITVDGAEVVSADLEADNGVIHVINSVLLPPDVAEALGVAMDDDMVDETTTTTTTTEAPEELGTIVDVAVESGEFPTLVAALQATGLDEVLSGEGPFTVFAPTEDAFAAALEALGISAEELLADTETLTSILTYHVVAADAPAEVVVTLDGQDVETVNGATVLVTIDGDNVMVNDANVVAVDIFGSNGVIHVIDSVLLPPAE